MPLLVVRYLFRQQAFAAPLSGLWTRLTMTLIVVAAFAMTPLDAQSPNATPSVESAGSPNIVAVVNAHPITRGRLANAAVDRYGVEVLDNLVNRFLIMQACNANSITISKDEISGEVQRLAQKFGLSMDAYLKLLQDERGITTNQYSSDIIYPMLALRKLVADKIEVTQEEFNQAFEAEYGEAVKCRLIMKKSRADALTLQAKAKAEPASFGELAKRHSEDEASASVGGLIPPIRRHTGDSRLESMAFALQDGEVSEMFQLGDQWIFMQAVRRIPATRPSQAAWPAVRETLTDRIRDQKMKVAASELFQKLQAEAKVVKVLGDKELMNQNPGVAAIINGQNLPIKRVAEVCVDRHGEDVLEGEINREVLRQALGQAQKQITEADLQSEVARAAQSFGFVSDDGKPEISAWLESVVVDGGVTKDVYMSDTVWPSVALSKLVEDEVALTQKDLDDGFEAAYGPRVEVLAIVLSDQRVAEKVWKLARDNPSEEFFGRLASQYSVEPISQDNFGKVPPIRQNSGQPAVEREAFAMKPGELSGIISTGGNYILLKCQGFTEPVVNDPSIVQKELVRDLTERKRRMAMAKKIEELRDAAEIDNFLAAVKRSNAPGTPLARTASRK
ncbi:MAG: peptidylprolyl isomerase [Planctomycetota bacterium]